MVRHMEQDEQRRWESAVAATLRAERGIARLSQADVARITGIARSSYRLYESAERVPDAVQLARIAEAFKVPWLRLVSEINRRAT